MSDIVIRVNGLRKLYRIGEKHVSYDTIHDTLVAATTVPWWRFRKLLLGQTTVTAV